MPKVITDGQTGFMFSSIEEIALKLDHIKYLDRVDCHKWVEEGSSSNVKEIIIYLV